MGSGCEGTWLRSCGVGAGLGRRRGVISGQGRGHRGVLGGSNSRGELALKMLPRLQ